MSLFSKWDSSEGIVTGRGGGLLRNQASVPCKDNSFFSLPKALNPLCRPPGLLVSNEGFCLRVKRLGREACHIPSSSAEAKNKCSYTYISAFWLRARRKCTPCPYTNWSINVHNTSYQFIARCFYLLIIAPTGFNLSS